MIQIKLILVVLFFLIVKIGIGQVAQSSNLGMTKSEIYKKLVEDKQLKKVRTGKDNKGVEFYSAKDTVLNSERLYTFKNGKICDAIIITFRYNMMEIIIDEFNKNFKNIKPKAHWIEYGQKNIGYSILKTDPNYFLLYISYEE